MNIQINNNILIPGSNNDLHFTITNNNQTVNEGQISAYFHGSLYKSDITNGNAYITLPVPDTPNKTENLKVTLINNTIKEQIDIKIHIIDTPIKIDNIYSFINSNKTLNINITPIINTNGTVIINLNKTLYQSKVINGQSQTNITLPNTGGKHNLTVTYVTNKKTYTHTVTIGTIGDIYTTFIRCNNYSGVSNNPGNLTGRLINMHAEGIANQTINLNITRVIDGASKNYQTITDENGYFNLPIDLATNFYTVQATYNGNEEYTSSQTNLSSISIYKDMILPKTGTILTADKYNEPAFTGKNFTGKLIDNLGNPIAGQHIYLSLTRNSNGASKVYMLVTNYKGEYIIPINLAKGEYTALCSYPGTSNYQYASTNTTLIVN